LSILTPPRGKIVFAPGVRWTHVERLRLTPQKRNNIAKSPLSRVIIVSHLKFTLESTADHEVLMMAKFLFVLSRGLEDPSRATRCMQLAAFAKRAGHDVTVFLVDDGAVFAKPGIAALVSCPTGDKMQPYVDELVAADTPFLVCTPCAISRQLDEKEFIEGAYLETAKTLIALAVDSKVFTF